MLNFDHSAEKKKRGREGEEPAPLANSWIRPSDGNRWTPKIIKFCDFRLVSSE